MYLGCPYSREQKLGWPLEYFLLSVSPGPYILIFQRALKAKQEKRPNQILKLRSGISQDWEYHLGDPSTKDSHILGSKLVSPYFGQMPHKQA